VDDRVSLLPFGFTISLPDLLSFLISLSLPISFSIGQSKTRKINERKKEEKDKKVLVAKKKEEWCVFVQRGMVYFFLRKNMFWRIEITSWHWRLLRLEAGAAQDYRG
jgi:hypothetical protein